MLPQSQMTPKKEISFLLQVALPFAALAWWKSIYFVAPVAIILLSLPVRTLRQKVIHAWQSLGELLGKIISPIILSALYYLGLTPLALMRRVLGKDELNLKKPLASNLKAVQQKTSVDSFDDLW